VNDQFGIPNEIQKRVSDVGKARFIGQEIVSDAVHSDRAFVDGAVGLQIGVEPPVGLPAIHQLDAANFDNPMSLGRIEAGRFGVWAGSRPVVSVSRTI